MTYLGFLALVSSIIMTFGDRKGKLIGSSEEWSDDCNLAVRGRKFNGRKSFYVLWIPIYRVGFYHSTMWFD